MKYLNLNVPKYTQIDEKYGIIPMVMSYIILFLYRNIILYFCIFCEYLEI